ncbi:MAG: hypothetical protein LRZ88_01450 [Candidatus Cloacimonetes bacterium]|nr:hypothetical protein [Candidatus Cloacimonadota bacterium]
MEPKNTGIKLRRLPIVETLPAVYKRQDDASTSMWNWLPAVCKRQDDASTLHEKGEKT